MSFLGYGLKRCWVTAWILVLVACTEPAGDGGFAGLADQVGQVGADEFLQPGPGDRLQFPEDFGPHPQHRIEWWYLTANLKTSDGQPLGLQWTQFRQTLKPRSPDANPPKPESWPLESAWMAHAAVSFQGRHDFAERMARGDVGHAGAEASPLNVWLDHWSLTEEASTGRWRLQVQGDEWAYDLRLSRQSAPVAHGDGGFSAKSFDGQGSLYFSLTDLAIEGTVTLNGQVLNVQGKGWFDREWSSQFLKASQQGWDWFALHLDDGHKLMAFRLRDNTRDFLAGSWIAPDGSVTRLTTDQIELAGSGERTTGSGRVPDGFRLRIRDANVDIRVQAPAGNYWNTGLYPYWESPVSVDGSHTGVGYMELTGYGP